MKKTLVGLAAIAALALPAAAAADGNGNAWGKDAGACFAPLGLSLGQAIQLGRDVHPGLRIVPETIVESPHCS